MDVDSSGINPDGLDRSLISCLHKDCLLMSAFSSSAEL